VPRNAWWVQCSPLCLRSPSQHVHARGARGGRGGLHRPLQPPPLTREPGKPHTRRCLYRQGGNHPQATKGDQAEHHPPAPLAAQPDRGIN
jgi:hypothetical protein